MAAKINKTNAKKLLNSSVYTYTSQKKKPKTKRNPIGIWPKGIMILRNFARNDDGSICVSVCVAILFVSFPSCL